MVPKLYIIHYFATKPHYKFKSTLGLQTGNVSTNIS